jgi:hypothetical protein
MRRFVWIAGTLVALAAAGLAIADSGGTNAVRSVSASFSATGVSNSQSKTCTNQDGSFTFTRARYAGAATSSDPSLNGPITLDVRSSINTTKNLGVVDGKLRIATASGKSSEAHFSAVYASGHLNGLAVGHAQTPYARLIANLSAGFSAAGGFASGQLGSTAAGGGALELQPGRCEPTSAQKQLSEARGTVSALSLTSITVGGLTCSIPANLAAEVSSHVKLGARVEIRCMVVNGQSVLVKVRAHDEEH